jgi:ribonuclease Z
MELSLAGLDLVSDSRAGLATCHALPSLRLCFDIGWCTPAVARRCRTVLSTHGHVDHLACLAQHVSQRAMQRMPPTRLVVQEEEAEGVAQLLRAWEAVSRTPLPCELVPVQPGSTVELGKGLRARAFRASHRVPTVGYAVHRVHHRLRPELQGVEGPEIARRRAAGEEVREPVEELLVAFTGDTRPVVLAREPWLDRVRLLIMECTFLDDEGAEQRADRTGHTDVVGLVRQLVPLLERGSTEVLLTHGSVRYPPRAFTEALDRHVPPELRHRVRALEELVLRPG